MSSGAEALTRGAPELIDGRYRLGRRIGHGRFGQVFVGIQSKTNEAVAVKLESRDAPHFLKHHLCNETTIYKQLSGCKRVPRLLWSGQEGNYNAIVLDLLGPSLEDLRKQAVAGRLSLKQALTMADQMIECVECLHNRGLVHRDIKPGNFAVGRGAAADLLYILDFGLTKRYSDQQTGQHILKIENRGFAGTQSFASLNAQNGLEQSRRDDLESVGLVLVYLLKGALPWSHLKAQNAQRTFEKIQKCASSTSIKDLCAGLPKEVADFLKYCRSLDFEACPDYSYLRGLLARAIARECQCSESAPSSPSIAPHSGPLDLDSLMDDSVVGSDRQQSCESEHASTQQSSKSDAFTTLKSPRKMGLWSVLRGTLSAVA